MRLFKALIALLLLLSANDAYARIPYMGGTGNPSVALAGKQVATGGYLPNVLSSTSTNAMMTRHCPFMRDNVTSFKNVLPGFVSTPLVSNYLGMEITPTSNRTYNEWIEYPPSSSIGPLTQITCSGSTTCTAPAGSFVTTDAASVTIPNGAQFCTWVYEPSGTPLIYTGNFTKVNGFLNETSCGNVCEGTIMGSSGVPSTPTLFTDNQFGKLGAVPTAIIATTTVKSVYIGGDSRAQGVQDSADSTGDLGNVARAIGPTTPYINGGNSGLRLSAFIFSNTNQLAMAKLTTSIASELVVNDWYQFGNTPLVSILAYKYREANIYKKAGLPYTWFTVEPVDTTTDACITTTNQTPASWNSIRISYNNTLRAGVVGISGYGEIANAIEANVSNVLAQDGGYWFTPNQSPDCVHEARTGNLAVAAYGGVSPSAIVNALPPTITDPGTDLTMVSPTYDTATPKFGTASLSGGYGTNQTAIVPGAGPLGVAIWVKPSSSALGTALGSGPLSIGTNASCFMNIRLGNGSNVAETSTSLCDGNWHWISATSVPTSTSLTTVTMYIDNVVPTGGTTTYNMASGSDAASLLAYTVRTLATTPGTLNFPGEVDEAIIFNNNLSNFTAVPTVPFTGSEAGLIAVQHLDSSGNGVAGPALP